MPDFFGVYDDLTTERIPPVLRRRVSHPDGQAQRGQ